MADFLKLPNMAALEALQNHEEGEVAFLEDEKSYMIYHGDKWLPVEAEMTNDGLQLNLYELNKQVISQLPPFDDARVNDAIDSLNAWSTKTSYLLYGKEISYFTLLMENGDKPYFENFGKAIISLLNDLGDKIYSLDILDDNTVEIWVEYEGNPTVLYLFNYEDGIVTYGR